MPRRTGEHAHYAVTIHDGRPIADELTLEGAGIELVAHETAVKDFYDDAEVEAVYYPEVVAHVKQATGAAKVVVFDHTVRVEGDGPHGAPRRPVRVVHNDYTELSGPQRVRDLVPADEVEAWLAGRFAIINVWRPIRGPVEAAPLAACDARSLAPGDLVPTDLVYQDRTGEIYSIAFNPAHRWIYFPHMQANETMLIKSYDSATDGRARFTPHSAFDHPATPAEGAVRESIEVRTLVFFDA